MTRWQYLPLRRYQRREKTAMAPALNDVRYLTFAGKINHCQIFDPTTGNISVIVGDCWRCPVRAVQANGTVFRATPSQRFVTYFRKCSLIVNIRVTFLLLMERM